MSWNGGTVHTSNEHVTQTVETRKPETVQARWSNGKASNSVDDTTEKKAESADHETREWVPWLRVHLLEYVGTGASTSRCAATHGLPTWTFLITRAYTQLCMPG